MRYGTSPIGRLVLPTALFIALWASAPKAGFLVGGSKLTVLAAEIAFTVLWVGLSIAIVRGIAGLRLQPLGMAVGIAISLAALSVVAALRVWPPLANLCLIYAASFMGALVAVIFREPNILLPVALMTPLVDYWTITMGPVRQILDRAPDVLPAIAAGVPTPGQLAPVAFIGVGDFLFMAMFLSAAERLRMDPRRSAIFFFVLVSLAMVLVVMTGLFSSVGVPGLVVIGLGFVAANVRYFHLSRREIAITSGLIAAVAGAVLCMSLLGKGAN